MEKSNIQQYATVETYCIAYTTGNKDFWSGLNWAAKPECSVLRQWHLGLPDHKNRNSELPSKMDCLILNPSDKDNTEYHQ